MSERQALRAEAVRSALIHGFTLDTNHQRYLFYASFHFNVSTLSCSFSFLVYYTIVRLDLVEH